MYLCRGFVLPAPSITKQSLKPAAGGEKIALPCWEILMFLHTQHLVLTDLRNFHSFDQRANMLAAPPNGKSPRIIMSAQSVHTRDPPFTSCWSVHYKLYQGTRFFLSYRYLGYWKPRVSVTKLSVNLRVLSSRDAKIVLTEVLLYFHPKKETVPC